MTEDVTVDLFQKTESVPKRSYEGKIIDLHGLCICFLQLMSQNSQGKTISHGQGLKALNTNLRMPSIMV